MSDTATSAIDPAEAVAQIDRLMRKHAKRIARHCTQSLLDEDDLYQEAAIGAMDAATRFDPAHGVHPSTFTARRAVGAMVDANRRSDRTYRRSLAGGPEKIAVVVPMSSVLRLASASPSGTRWLRDRIEPAVMDDPRPTTRVEFRRLVRGLGVSLTAVQMDALTLVFVEGMTQAAAAAVLGVGESRVSQLIAQVVVLIRERVAEEGWTPGDVAELLCVGGAA